MTNKDKKDILDTLSNLRSSFDRLSKAGMRGITDRDIHLSTTQFELLAVPDSIQDDGETPDFWFKKALTENGIVIAALYDKKEEIKNA